MFVCVECAKDYWIRYDTGYAMFNPDTFLGSPSSYGPCAKCKETKPCYDLRPSRYAHKDSQYAKDNIQKEVAT